MTDTPLHKVASSDDWLTRRRAIIELSHSGQRALFPTFIRSLNDPVSEVRHAAILALARLKDPRAVAELAKPKFLQSSDLNIRLSTVKALGQLGDIHIIDAIIPLVDDEEWLVRNEAISVLQDKIHEIVQQGDPSLARILMRMLSIDEKGITEMAIKGLIEMHAAIRHLLLDGLKNVKEPVRCHIAFILGEAREAEAVPALILALKDPSPAVRAQVALALGKIGDKRVLSHLIDALNDFNDPVRKAIVQALIRIGPDCITPLHIELSYTDNPLIKLAIIEILGTFGHPSSMKKLISYLSDGSHAIRSAAVQALSKTGKAAIPELLNVLATKSMDISYLLKTAGEVGDGALRIRALKALGELEDARALPVLKQLIGNADPDISGAAQEALVRVGCAAWGRCGALTILGKTADATVIDYITPLLKDDSPHVRYEAIQALKELKAKDKILDLAKTAQSDAVHEIRSMALQSMRDVAAGSAILFDTALALINDEAVQVRLEAIRILGDYLDPQAVEPLLEHLSDPHWIVRISAENALCNYGRKLGKRLITRLPKLDAEGRCRIISILARTGETGAIEPLEKLAADENEPARIRSIAREALTLLRGETGRQKHQAGSPLF